jgi:hypothetical protein
MHESAVSESYMAASPFRIYVVATFDDSDFTNLDASVDFDSCHGAARNMCSQGGIVIVCWKRVVTGERHVQYRFQI